MLTKRHNYPKFDVLYVLGKGIHPFCMLGSRCSAMKTCHRGSYHSSSGYCSGGVVIVVVIIAVIVVVIVAVIVVGI